MMGAGNEAHHRLINPASLPTASGFSHVVEATSGRLVFVAGQVGSNGEGVISSQAIEEQFDVAVTNVITALDAAGARPEDVVSLLIYVTDVAEYRERLKGIGSAYRARFGRHYPAMALFGVAALFDPMAKVELVATAVVPER